MVFSNLLTPYAKQFEKKITILQLLKKSTRKEFRSQDFDIKFKTKKNLELNPGQYYVLAFYDADDDFNNDTPIEVIIHHNFSDTDRFQNSQITDLLVQIFDAVVHEIRHQAQSRHRGYQTYSHHESEPYQKYLADPDELDAYALSIAIELLRIMPKHRAQRYMTRMTVLSKMRLGHVYASPILRAYIEHYRRNPLLKKLAKKIYKHLETLDRDKIFS